MGDAGAHVVEAKLSQMRCNERRSFGFPVAEFGVLVDLVAKLDDLRHQSLHRSVDLCMLSGCPADWQRENEGDGEGRDSHGAAHRQPLVQLPGLIDPQGHQGNNEVAVHPGGDMAGNDVGQVGLPVWSRRRRAAAMAALG